MTPNEKVVVILGAIGAGVLGYMAFQQTGDKYVPQIQGEGQAMGLGVQASMRVNAGTPLDMSPEIHFWEPGFHYDSQAPQPTVQSRHRYPSIPGGNMSTVMHKGWSSMCDSAPAGNSWFNTPPEVAVL
jgi:hypothetical protein